ncbi:hypothetical protein [Streptomyces justiciae]|uniref:hypothetical protein n=1 Tax=Streptomyces justiciae TaxID=2780140 RepID=UPI001D150E5C|nr:hypothetical protein [Streptomyces justiciae]
MASLKALLTSDAVSLSDGNSIRGCARVRVLSAPRDGIHQVLWVFNPDKVATFLGSRSRGAAALGWGSPGGPGCNAAGPSDGLRR